MTEHTIDDLRAVAEFAGIKYRWLRQERHNALLTWYEKSTNELESDLLADSGMAAILRAFLRDDIRITLKMGGDGRHRCDYNGLSPRWEGTSNWHTTLPHAVLDAAVQYVKVRRMK